MPEYLFVYGTLRQELVGNNTKELAAIMQRLTFINMGRLHGQMFDLGEYPGAIVGKDFDTWITGEIYQMPNPRETLELLDVYEGFIPGELEASLFARIKVHVTLRDETAIECWMYVYNDWVLNGRLIEDGDYVKYLKTKFGLAEK